MAGVRHHVLPNAIPGIAPGAILSVARALGETAPILFVASLFSKTAPTGVMDCFLALPIQIFFWSRHPKESFHDLAASTILVLLMLLLILNFIAIFIRNRAESGGHGNGRERRGYPGKRFDNKIR